MKRLILSSFLLGFGMFLNAAPADAINVVAMPVQDSEIIMDGVLSENTWKSGETPGKFQPIPQMGDLHPPDTRIKIRYSTGHLYVGIEAELADGEKPTPATVWDGDRVEMVLRTTLSDTYYYLFSLSACQVREDCAFANVEYNVPEDFDSKWKTAVHVDKKLWSAEIRIPFAAFENDPTPKAGSVWYINFCRGSGNSGSVSYSALNPAQRGFHNAACKLIFK